LPPGLLQHRKAASVSVETGGEMTSDQTAPMSAEAGNGTKAKRLSPLGGGAALAAEIVDAAECAEAADVVCEFYEHVPPSDIVGRSPGNLCGAALSLWRFAERRRPGQAKICVHNPDPLADGWSSPHTIVEIVNDDMPFLVDSVSLAINGSGRVVHLVIHPIVTVARDAQGRLLEVRDVQAEGLRESWMHVEITRSSDRGELAGLTRTLSGVCADVRVAVEDWRPMRERLKKLIDELSRLPLP